jgi:hypothetical protein
VSSREGRSFGGISPVRGDHPLDALGIETHDRLVSVHEDGHHEASGERLQLALGLFALADVAVVELDALRVQVVPNAAALLSGGCSGVRVQAVEDR